MINISYYDEFSDLHVMSDGTYQCDYPSKIYHSNVNTDVVYLTKKDPINCTSETIVVSGEYQFEEGYLYFVRIADQNANELVEYTRLYLIGEGPHQKVFGICEDKCKVQLPRMYFKRIALYNDLGITSLRSGDWTIIAFDFPEELADEDVTNWTVCASMYGKTIQPFLEVLSNVTVNANYRQCKCQIYTPENSLMTFDAYRDFILNVTFIENV